MKASFYFDYPARSLQRGGQRTLLAVFCIAVGVMAIVGLQLSSQSIVKSVTGDARILNQGDVSVQSSSAPISAMELQAFERLKANGLITAYTPQFTTFQSLITTPDNKRRFENTRVVDPTSFPLLGNVRIVSPAGASLKPLLQQPDSAVVTQSLASSAHLRIGDRVIVHAVGTSQVPVRIAGIIKNDNQTATGNTLDVSINTWQKGAGTPLAFNYVSVTTRNATATDQATAQLKRQFPLATVRTANDVLQSNKKAVSQLRDFLIIVGLLALLIGGVGIINTMQVLLSRRQIEIAILKTSGYQRRDLYLLFGVEAALLGFSGGVAGALLGILVSLALRGLFERATGSLLPAVYDPVTILGGIAVGLATALIFGLLPIVRAASARPAAVLRDLPEGRSRASWLGSAGLLVLLSLLFCVLASVILQSLMLGLASVYGGLVVLLLLSLGLSLVLWLLGRLPVPDRYTPSYLLLVSIGLLVALLIAAVPTLRGVGILIVTFALLGYAVVLLPRAWKVSMRLALRNISRTRGRTTTTLLALFIGVFSVGVVLVLGQDLRNVLTKSFSNQNPFNLEVGVSQHDAPTLQAALAGISGIQKQRASDYAGGEPVTINGEPIALRVPSAQNGPSERALAALAALRGVQGYSVENGDVPEVAEITDGRNLTAADAASANVIVEDDLRNAPLRLASGDRIELRNPQTNLSTTVTVVGFYKLTSTGNGFTLSAEPIFGSQKLARDLGGPDTRRVFFLKVPTTKIAAVQDQIETAVPGAFVFNIGDIVDLVGSFINNFVLVFAAIGALSLIAGVVIVANAVALAMLERRREIGVLKALGYTSSRVLGGVLLENALTAGIGGLLGMVLVALAIFVFTKLIKVDLSVGAPIAILMVLGVVALAAITALLVAWQAVRVRPLEVLRYE